MIDNWLAAPDTSFQKRDRELNWNIQKRYTLVIAVNRQDKLGLYPMDQPLDLTVNKYRLNGPLKKRPSIAQFLDKLDIQGGYFKDDQGNLSGCVSTPSSPGCSTEMETNEISLMELSFNQAVSPLSSCSSTASFDNIGNSFGFINSQFSTSSTSDLDNSYQPSPQNKTSSNLGDSFTYGQNTSPFVCKMQKNTMHRIRRPWEDEYASICKKVGISPKKSNSIKFNGYRLQLTSSSSMDSLVDTDNSCSTVSETEGQNRFSRPMFSFLFGSRLAASNVITLDSLDSSESKHTPIRDNSPVHKPKMYKMLKTLSPCGQLNNKLLSDKEVIKENTPVEGKKSRTNQYPRKRLNQHGVNILNQWYDEHSSDPYPANDVVLQLAEDSGLTETQIRKWMANKRLRSKNTAGYCKYYRGKNPKGTRKVNSGSTMTGSDLSSPLQEIKGNVHIPSMPGNVYCASKDRVCHI